MGPLEGTKIIEIAGIGPGPFAAMMLADMGAEVIRIDRKSSGKGFASYDVMNRGRKSISLDLKEPRSLEVLLKLVEKADALMEGFRPGVAERLGFGPEKCLEINPRLVYGRMTGWGQTGPLKDLAGHDINYIAISGALYPLGRKGEPPVPPLNLVGDFGGGGLLLAFGIVCGLYEVKSSGKGQVVDAAMVDGSAVLTTFIYGLRKMGLWTDNRGSNLLDTGAHFYEVYETKDGRYFCVGAIEPQFYQEFLAKMGIEDSRFAKQMDRTKWPELKDELSRIFKTKTRDEWSTIFKDSDACAFPVLDMNEAPEYEHNKVRGSFIEVDGVIQPAPAPRFSRTAPAVKCGPPVAGAHSEEILSSWGFDEAEIKDLKENHVIG